MTCGVSMPTWTTGPGTRAWASASRAPKSPTALGVDGPPGQGLPELGSADGAVEVAVQREVAVSGAHGGGRGGQRVEQRRGGDVGGPLHADLGPEPGLHPAHLGCLRDDQHGRCHASTRQKSRAARVVPRTEPDTFDRVPSGARVVADVALGEPPPGHGGLLEQLDRVAEPAVPHVQLEQRRRGGTPASARCRGRSSRSAGAATTRPGCCRGARATARRRGRPDAGGRRPGRRGRTGRRRAAPAGRAASNEPSPSMNATYSPVAASRPACTAAPYPASGSWTTVAPHRSATSAVSSRDPLSTTTTSNPAGTVGSRSSRAAASSRHGSTRSHTVSTSATVGRSGVRETALPPYELVTPSCRASAVRSRT